MPTLNELYRDYHNGFPEYHNHLINWINHLIRPYQLPTLTVFLESDYISLGTYVSLETPWGSFRTSIDSAKVLDGGQDWVAQQVATKFAEWLNSQYLPPGDNIELGEN